MIQSNDIEHVLISFWETSELFLCKIVLNFICGKFYRFAQAFYLKHKKLIIFFFFLLKKEFSISSLLMMTILKDYCSTWSDKGASASRLWEVTFSAISDPFVSRIILKRKIKQRSIPKSYQTCLIIYMKHKENLWSKLTF